MSQEFVDWLREQLNQRDWSQNRLAKEAGLSSSALSRVMNGEGVTFDVCKALAEAMSLPAEEVLYRAGMLPRPPEWDQEFEEVRLIMDRMTGDQRDAFLTMGRSLVKREGARRERVKAK